MALSILLTFIIGIATGVISGLVLAVLLVLVDSYFKAKIHAAGPVDFLHKKVSRKGKLIEPESPFMENFLGSLPKE